MLVLQITRKGTKNPRSFISNNESKMNSVGSRFHWVSRTCRIHVLRLQADMWSEVFIPLTSVAKFPLIWIRLKLRPSFSNCCLPKSTSDLRILPVLCVTISNEGSAVHAVSAITFSRSDQDKCKWGMRDLSNRRVSAQWVYGVWLTVSLQLLQMDPSACYARTLCWRKEPYEEPFESACPDMDVCCSHSRVSQVAGVLPTPPRRLCQVSAIMSDLF